MGEFQEVMQHVRRMCLHYPTATCKTIDEKKVCPFYSLGEECPLRITADSCPDYDAIERVVMNWVAAHPEPQYPRWCDWLKENGIVKEVKIAEGVLRYDLCDRVIDHMPADIAKLLKLKPEEVLDDA